MKTLDFVHLHVHSSYSLLKSSLTISKMVEQAVSDRMPALALTDTNALFGALEFSEAASYAGLQPIIGVHLAVRFDGSGGHAHQEIKKTGDNGYAYLTLLAQNTEGYGHLMALSSAAFLSPETPGTPHVTLHMVQSHS